MMGCDSVFELLVSVYTTKIVKFGEPERLLLVKGLLDISESPVIDPS